jgi:hypothetical protein
MTPQKRGLNKETDGRGGFMQSLCRFDSITFRWDALVRIYQAQALKH